jgi:hypothetical protein
MKSNVKVKIGDYLIATREANKLYGITKEDCICRLVDNKTYTGHLSLFVDVIYIGGKRVYGDDYKRLSINNDCEGFRKLSKRELFAYLL